MKRFTVLIVSLLVLTGAFVALTFLPSAGSNPSAAAAAREPEQQAGARRTQSAATERERSKKATTTQARTTTRHGTADKAGKPSAPGAPSSAAGTDSGADAKTPREVMVTDWETLVDQVIEQKDVPAHDQAQRVKKLFDRLDKADQMDAIHRALNLLPDEQFPALYAILYDKTEDPDVLDAIFSDALNRPEEIKNPLMKELRKDREHPMFFESARILDVVEPEAEREPTK